MPGKNIKCFALVRVQRNIPSDTVLLVSFPGN